MFIGGEADCVCIVEAGTVTLSTAIGQFDCRTTIWYGDIVDLERII